MFLRERYKEPFMFTWEDEPDNAYYGAVSDMGTYKPPTWAIEEASRFDGLSEYNHVAITKREYLDAIGEEP